MPDLTPHERMREIADRVEARTFEKDHSIESWSPEMRDYYLRRALIEAQQSEGAIHRNQRRQ